MTKRVKPSKPPAIRRPASPLDAQVFETLGSLFDKLVTKTRAGDSHRWLQGWFKKLVREGRMSLRRLIEYTRDKNWAFDADEALRDIADEMQRRREHPPEILQSYLICFPKPARGRGRRETDNFLRDQCIAICVGVAVERWSAVILLTRNDATEAPSICSIMSDVCRARGIKIREKRVLQIYERFAEFMPVHQGWLTIKSNSPI